MPNIESSLKKILRDEISRVKDKIIASTDEKEKSVLKQWLQSLQRVEHVCEERNRY